MVNNRIPGIPPEGLFPIPLPTHSAEVDRFPANLDADEPLDHVRHVLPLYRLFLRGFEERKDWEAVGLVREAMEEARAGEWEKRRVGRLEG